MRPSRRSIFLLAAALALSPACKKKSSAPPDDLGPFTKALAAITATCAQARGEVEVRRAGKSDWTAIEGGAVFHAGDEVRTGAHSFARVEFVSGGRLELEEKASVLIDAAPVPQGVTVSTAAARENRVKVGSGVVRGFLPEAKAGAEQPGMVIDAGEGGPVRLAAEPGKKPVAFRLTRGAKKTELAVTQGQARLTAQGGKAQAVRSGQAVEVTAAGLTDPADLIDFPPSVEPGIDARFHFDSQLRIRLAWKPVAEASGYRVQVASDLSFQAAEVVADVDGTEYAFSPSSAGLHAWRVAARDAQGRYGEYGFARRIFCEQEQPKDLLIGPEDDTVLRYSEAPPRISFSWESAANARSYRLVVASGENLLEQKVVSMVSAGQRLDVEGLGAGEYWWGVYVDGESAEPIFVKPRRLVVQKVAGAKVKVPKTISEWGN